MAGVNRHDGVNQVGPLGGHGRRESAAERVTDGDDGAAPEVLDERDDVRGQRGDLVAVGGGARSSVAAEVEGDDPMGGGEVWELPGPVVGVARESVDEDQCWALGALVSEEQPDTADVDECHVDAP